MVQTEQIVVGGTTGLSGAQTDDGVLETLFETDTAPDGLTAPSTETITTGTKVAGVFPTDIQTENGVFNQYRESTDAVEAAIGYRSNTGANTVNSTKTRTWDGSTWTAETEQATAGSPIRAVRMAWPPVTSTTRIIVTQSDDGWLDAYVCTPTCTVTNNIGQVWSTSPGNPQKRFDIAYEQLSGDALLVSGVLSTNTTRDIAYRTYVGGTWSAEQYLDDTGHATDIQYSLIRLASKKGSDQIGLVGGDDTDDDVNAWIWDGSTWGSDTEITASAENPQREQAAIAWESNSGHLLAVAVVTGTTDIISKEFTTGWSATSQFTCAVAGAKPRWLSLKPNPLAAANDMVLAVGDDNPALDTCYWTGSAWANFNTHDTTVDAGGTRVLDFAWENTGSKGLLVWGTTAGQITYRTFTAPNTWVTITNVAMGANAHAWVQLRTNLFPRTGATKILGAVMETTALDLGAITWDGSTFTVVGASTFTADTGTTTYDSFDLQYHATNDDQLLVRYDWSGVPTGDSYTLQVKGYREDENINVQVLTPPSTWNTRITVDSVTNQNFSYVLTPSEYNGGSPQVRFIDASGPGSSASDLFLDWVGITTVNLKYSLEVRQNVTGILGGANPTLVVKGNISAGGENFHVQVWNFTAGAWRLLLAAPFTATNAYHNASLAAGDLSGGAVRIRFVDAAALDTTRWTLSLDFVAVFTDGPPSLTNAGVVPASGNITTTFPFFVRYEDSENEAPAFVNLTLNGTSYAMTANTSADTNYADGKAYFLNLTIGIRGTFSYWFSTRASRGDTALVSTLVQQVSVLNRAPRITNRLATDSVHAGVLYVRDFNGTDLDGDTLAWSFATNASWLSIGAANGTVWGWAPATVTTFFVNASVSDGYGGSTWDNYTLALGNQAPTISNPIASAQSARRASFVRDFNAVDPDGDAVAWSVRSDAAFLVIGAGNGTVYGTTANVPATYWVEVTVSDGLGGTARVNFTLNVVNAPPQLTVTTPGTAMANDSYQGSVSGFDPDGDSLVWSFATNAPWLSMDPSAGTLGGTAVAGVYYANVTVRDPYGGTAYRNLTILVQPAPSPPPPPPSPPGGAGDPLISLLLLFLGAGALAFAIFLVAKPRRRPIVEQAFLLGADGAVRFEFAAAGAPFDEARLRSLLSQESWQELERLEVAPHTLHFVHGSEGHWILVSRSKDAVLVRKAAERVMARAKTDLPPLAAMREAANTEA